MTIPVEQIGSECQRIPATLVKIEKSVGLIQYDPKQTPVRVSLADLQLAPSAFDVPKEVPPVDSSESSLSPRNSSEVPTFSPRDIAEIWLSHETTTRKLHSVSSDDPANKTEEQNRTQPQSSGAWWPGRVLNVQGGFAHVEVAAPLADTSDDDSVAQAVPHLVRMGSSILPYRSTLVKLDEVRVPWHGRPVVPTAETSRPTAPATAKENTISESLTLLSTGVLHRHTICIPVYLARLATSTFSHSTLVKFCGAPCLVQCDPEPFLAAVMAKRILADSSSRAASGRQTPSQQESEVVVPAVSLSSDTQVTCSPAWPSPATISQSTILNPPNIVGALSSTGVTDPALLLEGLPGANGPLVLLHIWSGSLEAIRRASLLELAHVRILVFRYHLMRKRSNGEPGELDLVDSIDAPVENGDAPVMHCKPISIPVQSSKEEQTPNDRAGGMMIGYSGRFRIQPDLIGLAIGYHGATIQEARGLPGVRTVDLLQDGIVHVEAETVEACQAVRHLLDFTEAEIPVSSRLASRLIGSKGMNIRKLASSAGVRRAVLLDPLTRKKRQQQTRRQPLSLLTERDGSDLTSEAGRDEHNADGDKALEHTQTDVDSTAEDGTSNATKDSEKLPPPAFYLLGTRSAVAKMRLLLEFQADNWNELDELEEARRSLYSQLRQASQPPSESVNGAPMRGGPGPRGSNRGRWTSGRGGSMDGAHDGDTDAHPQHDQGAYRGRGRAPNGGPFSRPPGQPGRPPRNVDSSTVDGTTQNANATPGSRPDGSAGKRSVEPRQSAGAVMNGGGRYPERGRGRGRARAPNAQSAQGSA
ncbi:Fragile X mental retardation syndrome 1 [Fasciola gigantica]|uniref:Fragile X mental retardation syndrome 1 n=1 Tax=Fasciola gigantica TaxID=46835 RepID=A0A504YCP6_FASGI|nr:Fragile X mental retardation syndrome 1 [Fasciola gigantica]